MGAFGFPLKKVIHYLSSIKRVPRQASLFYLYQIVAKFSITEVIQLLMSDGRTTKQTVIQNILQGLGICADNGEKEEYIQELL